MCRGSRSGPLSAATKCVTVRSVLLRLFCLYRRAVISMIEARHYGSMKSPTGAFIAFQMSLQNNFK